MALIPDLIHPDHRARPPDEPRQQRRSPKRKLFLVLPRGPVKGHASQHMEQEVLFQHDRHPGAGPVTHKWEKILKDLEQMVTAGDGADQFDDGEHDTPDPARDGFRVAPQDLAAQGSGICGRCVVGDAAEGEDDDAESPEAAEAVVAGEEERAA